MEPRHVLDFSAGIDQFASSTAKNIKRPREIAYYSLDQDRKTLPLSTASLKYSYPCISNAPFEFGDSVPPQDLDAPNRISLRDGFEHFQKFDDLADEHLDAILETITAHEQSNDKIQPHLVMFRGMMTKLMTIPYDNGNDAAFQMNATYFDGTIYIEQHKAHKLAQEASRTQRDQRRPQHMNDRPSQEEMQYWGYKFETLCALDRPYVECSRGEIEARRTAIINNAEQYCSIVSTGIDDTTIVLAGEVDAVRGIKPEDPEVVIPWIEFKTNRTLESGNDHRFWGEKLLRVWAQSYLLGVPTVVVGFRSHWGQLLSIQEYKTQTLPSMAKSLAMRYDNKPAWNGSVCINFAGALFQFLRQHITSPGVVWRIERRPGAKMIELFISEDVSVRSIITEAFAKHREQKGQIVGKPA